MTILAHISDLHLIERDHDKRRGLARQRLAFLSTGRPLDFSVRKQRASACLRAARRAGADHLVITGDLTEDGAASQFEVLAEVLHDSGLDPEQITIIPGNHDAYSMAGGFARALHDGPLRAFASTSRNGARTVLPQAVIAPISTAIEGQFFTYAGGALQPQDLLAIQRLASERVSRDRAVVVLQHHPPHPRAMPVLGWVDGLKNSAAIRELVLERSRVHVLHGHTHRLSTRRLSGRRHAQVFGVPSVRDTDGPHAALRLYKAEECALHELVAVTSALQPLAARQPQPRPVALTPALV